MTPEVERTARRVILTVAVAAVSTVLAVTAQASVVHNTDFTQIWHAARGWRTGRNPYNIVGPGRPFNWPFPLLYPGTALIAAMPLTLLPLRWANAAMVGIGAGAIAWTLSRERAPSPAWWLFASAAWVYVIRTAQWAPLLMAAALNPSLGWLLACKPSVGAALFVAWPTRRAAVLMAAFVAVSIAVLPTWPRDWLAALPAAYHMTAPVTYLTAGGPLILLALMRWRRPEARLLVTLGCLPHTTMLYESLPLFLVVRRWQEGLLLAALGWVCMYRHVLPDYLQMMHGMAWRMTLFLYLPCVVMVLLRDNRWPEPSDASPAGVARSTAVDAVTPARLT